jgi:hypothetical protein
LSFWKPFALLMTLTWLNDSWPKKVFKNHDLQLLMFDKRIAYINAWKVLLFLLLIIVIIFYLNK